jgi:uncharacterized protein DUF6484
VKQEEFDQEQFEEQSTAPINNISPGEIVIGVFTGLNEQGKPLVNFAYNVANHPIVAITSVSLNQKQTDRQVALMFEEGDIEKPIIMGVIHNQLDDILDNFEFTTEDNTQEEDSRIASENNDNELLEKHDNAYLDGKRVVLEGKEEIVLKCGDASITLTKAGKILIRGKYLLNRSTGVNRIMGGSVQVN